MTKFLFLILALGFMAQCTGAAVHLKKTVSKTEQSPNDKQPGEENSNEEFKKEKDQIGYILITGFSTGRSVFTFPESRQFYPSGFSSKPYLPPR